MSMHFWRLERKQSGVSEVSGGSKVVKQRGRMGRNRVREREREKSQCRHRYVESEVGTEFAMYRARLDSPLQLSSNAHSITSLGDGLGHGCNGREQCL